MLIKTEMNFQFFAINKVYGQLALFNGAEGARNPVWNEKFVFRMEYPGSGDQYKLNLRIMDKDVFSANDFVGQAT